MDDALKSLLESGKLLHPINDTPNSVDLARTLAKIAGVEGIEETEGSLLLGKLIGDSDHLLFVIVDGLGMNIIEHLPDTSFMKSYMVKEIRAITPSTTACAFTAFATGLYPCESGITGWNTYLPEHRLTATVLPFLERYSETPLQDLGISVDSVFPGRVLMSEMRHTPLSILPKEIFQSVTSRHLRGETEALGYSSIPEAIDCTISAMVRSRSRSYTFLYLPQVDSLSHEKGPTHTEVVQLTLYIDNELNRLAQTLKDDSRLVITADHGQIAVPMEKRYLLSDGDPILEILDHPPTSEGRFPQFHVSRHRREEFVGTFLERFSESFSLLPLEEAENEGLFGPGELDSNLRPRFGNFVGIAKEDAILGYLRPGESLAETHIGRHGGLSPEEIRVPLIIA